MNLIEKGGIQMRAHKGMALFITALTVAMLATGCSWNDKDDRANRNTTRSNMVNPPTLLPSMRPDHLPEMHNNKHLTNSQETARAITKINEVRSATVLLSDNNAYVGIVINAPRYGQGQHFMGKPNRNGPGFDTVNSALRTKITDEVKKVNPSINNVYISADPTFIHSFNGFSNQVTHGNPIQSFISQFNDAMRKSFPINK
jgi:YhcN/YlaJ family sporulation lipoprotein